MQPITYNRKDTAAVLGISTLTVDDLERRGKLHRLPAFAGVRYSLKEIEQIAGAQGGKTLSKKELAERAGVAVELVYHYEKSPAVMNLYTIIMLANALNVEPSWMLAWRRED